MFLDYKTAFIPPTDKRYVHDKVIEFVEPTEDNDWDE